MPSAGTTHHADRIQSAISSNGAAKSALIASWQRSACLHKLDPARSNLPERLTDSEFRRARQKMEPLIQVAQPSLDRLYHSVGGAGCCVLLADRNGVPVARRGAPADDATFFDWGLWPGAIWSEGSEGTNGIGTCLVEQRALTIHRDQHFYARNALLSCTTAPIYDHQGRLVAALDVSSCRSELIENFINLIATAVSDAAARIEAECFRLAYPDARILVVPAPDKIGKALIAGDQDDLVVGATRAACLALGISQACLQKSLPAAEVMNMSRTVTENLAAAERGAATGTRASRGQCHRGSRGARHEPGHVLPKAAATGSSPHPLKIALSSVSVLRHFGQRLVLRGLVRQSGFDKLLSQSVASSAAI